jgi:predicted DsbA family dithiol-disulfide isomerase
VKVDIWSDVQCPWCYIGKRKFEAAATEFDGAVEIEYHSFELSPDTPVDYEGTVAEYLSQRKGMSLSQVESIQNSVTGRIPQLGDLAAEIGLDRDEVIRVLNEDVYLADVKADVALAQQYGIQGVPFFVVDGKYGISGAQDPAVFLGALRQAAAS